jgi:hypothetical protein
MVQENGGEEMITTNHNTTPGTDYAEKVQALRLRLEMELGAEGGRG